MKVLFVAVAALIALARGNPTREIHGGDDDDHEENCHCGVFIKKAEIEILHMHPFEDIENCDKNNTIACKKACRKEWRKAFGDGDLDHVYENKTLGQWLCEGATNVKDVMPRVKFHLCEEDNWAPTGKKAAEKLCCDSGTPIACNTNETY